MSSSRSKAVINNQETFWVRVSDQAVGSYSEREPDYDFRYYWGTVMS